MLYRQTANGWEALPTTVLYIKDGTIYFSAVSPGFSLFAIAGTPSSAGLPGVAATPEILRTPAQEMALTPVAPVKIPQQHRPPPRRQQPRSRLHHRHS